jgi:hypothetical protein
MEFRTSIPRTLGLLLLSIGMTAMCYFVARRGAALESAVGWIGVVFFGAGCLVTCAQLVRREASIVIDSTGISYVRLKEKIPWTAVASVTIGQSQRQSFLCIWLRDEKAYVARQSAAYRALAKANSALGFPAITIPFHGLSPGLEEAHAYIRTLVPGKTPLENSV